MLEKVPQWDVFGEGIRVMKKLTVVALIAYLISYHLKLTAMVFYSYIRYRVAGMMKSWR